MDLLGLRKGEERVRGHFVFQSLDHISITFFVCHSLDW